MTEVKDSDVGYSQVARDLSPFEAQVLLGRLQAEGIDAHLAGLNHAQANPLLQNALGGVRLFVRDAHRQQAFDVMAAAAQGDYALDDESWADAPEDELPARASVQVPSRSRGTATFILVMLFLLAVALAVVAIKAVWAQPSYDYFPYSLVPEPTSRIVAKWVFSGLFVLHPLFWLFFIVRGLRK